MSTYDLVADLPLTIDDYAFERLSRRCRAASSASRTVIHIRGGGEEGLGEDVTYDADEHALQQEHGPGTRSPASGRSTASPRISARSTCSRRRAARDVSATTAAGATRVPRSTSRCARRHARSPRLGPRAAAGAVRRLARMGEPPTIEPVARRLARYPDLRFKLDATPDWDDDLIAGLVELGAVDSIDFKGAYKGTPVDTETDPELYRRIAEAFPDAWLEDPDLETPGGARGAAAVRGPHHLGRADPLGRRHPRDAGAAAHGQPQAVALRVRAGAVRGLRLLRRTRDGRLRRRAVRARRRPRPDPVPGGAVPRRRAERHRAIRV